VRLNPAVEHAPSYPFLRILDAVGQMRSGGREVIDLSLGQPTEAVPAAVRTALARAAADTQLAPYPSSAGLAELRSAIASWLRRRFGVSVDPHEEVLPTLGAKEPISLMARLFARPGDVVTICSPSYPVPERSARAAGVSVRTQVLSPECDWLLEPDCIDWKDVVLVWVINPHNPTGAITPREALEDLAARCRHYGAILALDECYSEFWFDGIPPPSGLQLTDHSGVVVFNSLSKRSGVAGLRSGFIAGDPEIVRRVRRYRSEIGTTPPALIQQASIAAWEDDVHTLEARSRYNEKRELLVAAARHAGLEHAGGVAGIFLWLRVPGADDLQMFQQLLEQGIATVPGSYLGQGGEGYLRVGLTPTVEQIARAAELLTSQSGPM
jgi:aspartate/methionine/tyrosine aminotransferase